MNIVKIVTLTVLLVSCSGTPFLTVSDNRESNILFEESFFRFSHEKLSQFADQSPLSEALVECHKGNYKTGLNLFKKYYLKNKKSYKYWLQLGNCYYLQKSWSKAIYFYSLSKDLSKKEDQGPFLNNLALIHLNFGNYDKAKDLLKKAVKINKRFLTPKYNLSQLFLQFGHFERARKILHGLHLKAPNDINVLASLSYVMLLNRQYNSSLDFLLKIKVEDRKRGDIGIYLALNYYFLKRYDDSQETLDNLPILKRPYFSEIKKKLLVQLKKARSEKVLASNIGE